MGRLRLLVRVSLTFSLSVAVVEVLEASAVVVVQEDTTTSLMSIFLLEHSP
jgi:hypothetical protein